MIEHKSIYPGHNFIWSMTVDQKIFLNDQIVTLWKFIISRNILEMYAVPLKHIE